MAFFYIAIRLNNKNENMHRIWNTHTPHLFTKSCILIYWVIQIIPYLINIWQMFNVAIVEDLTVKSYIPNKSLLQWIWCKCLGWWQRQTRCLSVLDFWNVNLGVYYKLKKDLFWIKLDFFSSLNLIFTACVACKNQFRNQIDFSVF